MSKEWRLQEGTMSKKSQSSEQEKTLQSPKSNEIGLEHCLGFLTMSLNMAIRQHFSKAMADSYGLEHREAGILWVCHSVPTTQTQLSSYGDLDKNYARILVDNLESRGLVTRSINPKNRREKFVSLTKKGEKVAKESAKLMEQSQNAVLSPYLSKDEINSLHSLLLKCFLGMYKTNLGDKLCKK